MSGIDCTGTKRVAGDSSYRQDTDCPRCNLDLDSETLLGGKTGGGPRSVSSWTAGLS